jgi:superfamily II DNA or RNA helicase
MYGLAYLYLPNSLQNPRAKVSADASSENIIGVIGIDSPESLRALSRYVGPTRAASRSSQDRAFRVVSDRIAKSPLANNPSFYPYQVVGAAFALARKGRAMILDPMGLGKTAQAIGTLLAGGASYLPAAVVCPINAFAAWNRDIVQWTKLKPFVVAANSAKTAQYHQEPTWPTTEEKRLDFLLSHLREGTWPDDWVVVINYEKLIDRAAGVNDNIQDDVTYWLAERMSTVIFDEAHRLRNAEAAITHKARLLSESIDHVLLLTGTPILNAPSELWTLANFVSPKNDLKRAPIFPREEGPRDDIYRTFLRSLQPEADLIKTPAGWIDYAEYTPETTQVLDQFIRERGVRRTRRQIAITPGAMGPTVQLKEKERTFELVELDSNSEYLSSVFDIVSDTRKHPTSAALKAQLMRLSDWYGDLVYDIIKRAKGKLTEAQFTQQMQYAKDMLLRIKRMNASVPTELIELMGLDLVPTAVDKFKKATGSVLFFAYNHEVARDLGLALSEANPQTLVITALGSSEAYLMQNGELEKMKGGGSKFPKIISIFEDPNNTDKKALVLTPAGKEALNLPSADTVIFLQRLSSPGDEMQAEDRINRPQQKGTPKAIYLIPQDPLAMILTSRAERKRASMLASLGESPDDDFSRSVKIPWDMSSLSKRLASVADDTSFLTAYNVGLAILSVVEIYADEAFAVLMQQAESAAQRKMVNFVFPTIETVNRKTIRISASNKMREYLSILDLRMFAPQTTLPKLQDTDWLIPSRKTVDNLDVGSQTYKTVQFSHIFSPTLANLNQPFNLLWKKTGKIYAAMARTERGPLNNAVKFAYFAETVESHEISMVPFQLLELAGSSEGQDLLVLINDYPQMKVLPVYNQKQAKTQSQSQNLDTAKLKLDAMAKSNKDYVVTWYVTQYPEKRTMTATVRVSRASDGTYLLTSKPDNRKFKVMSDNVVLEVKNVNLR